MNAALLAYTKLANLFKEWGFVMNPYDPCVWNKMVGKYQMTIMFHIDDLVETDPIKWKKHLVKEDGRDMIYAICNKAIYGTMNAALLAYKKLANLFKEWGFIMNPYDPCVWNKMVGKYQMTIMFHIDDPATQVNDRPLFFARVRLEMTAKGI